ncbi:MAG: hypothetical protein IPN76_19470 [Saprospiraceae bacterium]|nr:hypothetical protein [Saprospiraceae bacterium]
MPTTYSSSLCTMVRPPRLAMCSNSTPANGQLSSFPCLTALCRVSTHQIAAIAGNPDGNGGVDLSDPCLSFSGGASVTFHLPPVADLPSNLVLGCNDYQTTVQVEITPPGNYNVDWDTWNSGNGPGAGNSISISNPGFLTAYISDPFTGCWTNSDTVQITAEPGRPIVRIQQQAGGSCGQMSVIANVTGGLAPFEYDWSNGSTGQTNVLTPGTHCVSITGADGCVIGLHRCAEAGNLAATLSLSNAMIAGNHTCMPSRPEVLAI